MLGPEEVINLMLEVEVQEWEVEQNHQVEMVEVVKLKHWKRVDLRLREMEEETN